MARDHVPVSYRALQGWARSAIRVVYRNIEVTGLSNVPTNRPAILAANHSNALADIAVIIAKTPRFPQFLAAASWWKSAPARVLFHLGGVVPIHRSRDGTDTTQNLATFKACHAALAASAHIAIFPEGEMRTGTSLMPLKTGAARIALGAATDAGVNGLVIVPIGIVYEDRGRFRSDLEIRFGEPIEIDPWVEQARRDPRQTARRVTDLLADRLTQATVNHPSRAEAALVDRAAAIATCDTIGTAARSYARRNDIRRSLASAISRAAVASSSAYRDLATAVETHDANLEQLGVSSTRRPPPLSAPSDEERTRLAIELALLAPAAALGLLTNAPIALAAGLASTRAKHESWKATTKGVVGTLLCPPVWTCEYAYLARRLGRTRAFAITTAGAASSLAALAWQERLNRRRDITRLDHAAKERPTTLAAARSSQKLVREHISALTSRT